MTGKEARRPSAADAVRVEPVLQIADAVVHDLGNLLAVIAGQTSLLEPLVRADPEGRESLAEIKRSVTACVSRLHELAGAIRQATGARDRIGQPMILLVEPDPSVSGLIESFLQSQGYQIVARPLATQALAHAEQGGVDLVIAATRPERLSDIYLIEELRKRQPRLPALVMSEFASTPPPRTDGDAPTEFLNKPFAMAALLDAVRRLIAR
jgi:CheY-like chemotaxis protein